ncbi:MAG: Mrp/NBP35 family ATP-binding protein [Flavobacteriales bacterium]|nr:Mrp/NBP35 family ATP-binding protein [Flavobacteriales bacterium]
MPITKEAVLEALGHVDDPDLKKDLVTLGMIRDLEIEGLNVRFSVVLTTPACPMKEMIQRACENAIIHYVNADARVDINMTSEVTSGQSNNKPALKGIKNIVAISSGKGGVGKSTVAANLAVALAKHGAKVGLIDADVYGPSVPLMFDVGFERPGMAEEDGKKKMAPVENYGVKLMSIGFFAEASQAVAWRGPMATKALNQMITDVAWGELDYLLVDLPPGTGDIHLTLVQTLPLTGAVVVTTPQSLAIADARKGMAMFRMEQINVPVLGLIENMSWFTPAELPENKYYIFGNGGSQRLLDEFNIPLLGQIPLIQSIAEASEAGRPIALQDDTETARAFTELAGKLAQTLAIRNASLAPSETVKVTQF